MGRSPRYTKAESQERPFTPERDANPSPVTIYKLLGLSVPYRDHPRSLVTP